MFAVIPKGVGLGGVEYIINTMAEGRLIVDPGYNFRTSNEF